MVMSLSKPLHEETDDDDVDEEDVEGEVTPLNSLNCSSLCNTTIVSNCNNKITLSSPVALVSVLTAEDAMCRDMLEEGKRR